MVVSASVMIVACLLVLVKQFWLIGLGMIFIGLWQILFICQIGMAYETSCEELLNLTYHFNWYLLTPKHRKYWHLLQTMLKRPQLSSLGGFRDANLNSFIKVSGDYSVNLINLNIQTVLSYFFSL